MESYAKALESYMIPTTEGFFKKKEKVFKNQSVFKKYILTPRIKELFVKMGAKSYTEKDSLCLGDLFYLIEDAKDFIKITIKEWKEINNFFFNFEDSMDTNV